MFSFIYVEFSVFMNPSPHPESFCQYTWISYDVTICFCSGSHHRKQELVKELQRNGVNFDVRKLNVGDFLWVAREKVAPVPGNTQEDKTRGETSEKVSEQTLNDGMKHCCTV